MLDHVNIHHYHTTVYIFFVNENQVHKSHAEISTPRSC